MTSHAPHAPAHVPVHAPNPGHGHGPSHAPNHSNHVNHSNHANHGIWARIKHTAQRVRSVFSGHQHHGHDHHEHHHHNHHHHGKMLTSVWPGSGKGSMEERVLYNANHHIGTTRGLCAYYFAKSAGLEMKNPPKMPERQKYNHHHAKNDAHGHHEKKKDAGHH